MRRLLSIAVLSFALNSTGAHAQQRQDETTVIDSIVVTGLRRVPASVVLSTADFPVGEPSTFRDVQRAMRALYALRQFEDVRFYQGTIDGKEVLRIHVIERPILTDWRVTGTERLSSRNARGRVKLLAGRPYDLAAAVRSKAAIDSLYEERGYYQTRVRIREVPQADGTLRVVFEIDEGRRVTVSRVEVEGNTRLSDRDLVGNMTTKPEGFWWFRKGEYKDDELERDVRERLPAHYASKGYVDFQVLSDTLVVNPNTGKGTVRLTVEEGEQYEVGTFEVIGNRFFEAEQLEQLYPFRQPDSEGFLGLGGERRRMLFDRGEWEAATEQLRTVYRNNGYLNARVQPIMARRTTADGRHVVDLRWQIIEGQPSIVNKIIIRGNTVTHESVIRRAISMVPGDIFRQDALIQSYQRISNIGFFEQPLPIPTLEQANQQGDVNVVFHVEERHTGNINFGASVGQGTGLGGFIGLDEPNLFGRGKQISLQWQFGRNIQDIRVSYTDPAIRGSLISGTISAHNTRTRFTVADLGRITTRGGSIQFGFPVFGSRFTRLQASYSVEQQAFDTPNLDTRFRCRNCVLSSLGMTLMRDTRIELPFPTGGTLHRLNVTQNGGIVGGSGNFQRATFEGRWYTTLTSLGGADVMSNPMKVVLGLKGQFGFVWGDPGPNFRQLFSMGGTQFGIPLRGYDEFSVTPQGFDPQASGFQANTVDAFGRSYFQSTAEIGLRLSRMLYLNTFFDAGNVWATPGQFNPTQLFRGAGVGMSLVTPLGPIGLDYAYGFDRTDVFGNPDPAWKFHFKLGNVFF